MQHLSVLRTIINPRFVQCDGEERPDRNHCQSMEKVHVGEVRVGGPTQRAQPLGFVFAARAIDSQSGSLFFSKKKNIQRFFTTHNNQTPARQQPHWNQTIAKQESNNTEATSNEKIKHPSRNNPTARALSPGSREAATRRPIRRAKSQPRSSRTTFLPQPQTNPKTSRRQPHRHHATGKPAHIVISDFSSLSLMIS